MAVETPPIASLFDSGLRLGEIHGLSVDDITPCNTRESPVRGHRVQSR